MGKGGDQSVSISQFEDISEIMTPNQAIEENKFQTPITIKSRVCNILYGKITLSIGKTGQL